MNESLLSTLAEAIKSSAATRVGQSKSRKSGHHFCEKDLLKLLKLEQFLPARRFPLAGKCSGQIPQKWPPLLRKGFAQTFEAGAVPRLRDDVVSPGKFPGHYALILMFRAGTNPALGLRDMRELTGWRKGRS
jgi:hypothetical protein